MTEYDDASVGSEPVRPRMTMRVYRVASDGTVTADLGKVSVMGDRGLAPMVSSQFPPCRCPLHRDGVAQVLRPYR